MPQNEAHPRPPKEGPEVRPDVVLELAVPWAPGRGGCQRLLRSGQSLCYPAVIPGSSDLHY